METMIYLLQVVLYTGLLWGIYRLALPGRVQPAAGRIFLLSALLLPFVLPLLHWQALYDAAPRAVRFSLPEFRITDNAARSARPGYSRLAAGYMMIAAVLLLKTALQHLRLRLRLRRHPSMKMNGCRVFTGTGIGPGSYGRRIFLPGNEAPAEIVLHEQAHIRYRHRYDLLLVQVLKIICWPNLFLYAVAADLKLLHEYQADACAASADTDSYTATLLNEALGTRQFSFTHAFFHPSIKNRIMMLHHPVTRAKSAYRMLRAGLLAVLLAATAAYAQTGKKAAGTQSSKEDVLQTVEHMPEFNGDMNTWLGQHLRYPEHARKSNAEGRSVVKFVVYRTGRVGNAELTKSSGHKELDDEALRVVRSMPDWKPGVQQGKKVNVYFSLPISFKLED